MGATLPHVLSSKYHIWILGGLICLSLWLSVIIDSILPAVFPILLIAGFFVFKKPVWIFLFIGLAIPISTEVTLPGNLGTDFPSEQLMWVVFGLGILSFLSKVHKIDLSPFLHPASLILIALFAWLWICVLNSEYPLISIKYALAKSWYLGIFFFIALYLFRDQRILDLMVGLICASVLFTMFIVILRHSQSGFTFEDVNRYLNPFYRNHVAYACMLGVAFPWLYYLSVKTKSKGVKYFIYFSMTILSIAIYFSYTRAAMLALIGAVGWVLVLKLKATKSALGVALFAAVLSIAFLVRKDKYLDFAPDYYKTISHKNFDNLLSATYKLEDISSMERVYRWVAGYYMVKEKPVFGFGPSTFYESYRPYTVNSFKTYVSDNPEKSGIHNYYLMIGVEQGIPGLLIWVVFCVYLLLLAQNLYNFEKSIEGRALILACSMTLIFVLIISTLNDMIETDKVGPLFYMSAAILTGMGIRNKIR